MHQLDPVLKGLDTELEVAATSEDAAILKAQIKEREAALMPMYLQVCHWSLSLAVWAVQERL